MIEKSKIRKKYVRHRTCESLSRTYIDVKTADSNEIDFLCNSEDSVEESDRFV